MGRTLVTGASGFVGSAVARALVARGDSVRAAVRASSSRAALEGLDVEFATAQLGDRAALRRALRGVDRVFHVAGTTYLRASDAELVRVNVEGTRVVMEEALRAGVERVVHTSSIGAVGPARPGGAVDERTPFPPGVDVPYAISKHAAETEALRVAARGLDVVIVCPAHVFGRGDTGPTSTGVVRRFLLRGIPAYVAGRDQRRRHRGRRRRAPARGRARRGRRALHPRGAELHVGAAVRGARATVRDRGAGAAGAGAGRAGARRGRIARPVPGPRRPAEVRAAGHWWTCKSGKARRERNDRQAEADSLEGGFHVDLPDLGSRSLVVARASPPGSAALLPVGDQPSRHLWERPWEQAWKRPWNLRVTGKRISGHSSCICSAR